MVFFSFLNQRNPNLHVVLAPEAREPETRMMKRTSSPSTRSFDIEATRQATKYSSALRALLLTAVVTAALGAGCGEDPTIRQSTGGGGAGGDNTGGGGGMVVPNDPLPLRVLNWNVHNLENDKDDSGAPGETIVSAAEYAAHRKAVGSVITLLDPDVAVLQEVENKAVLDDLNETELGGKYVASSLVDGNDYRGVDIAVLSKFPIDSAVSHKSDAFPLNGTQGPNYYYARDCAEIHISFNGRKMVFLGVHFKAKSNDDPIQRLAEAQHTRAIADGLAKEDPSRAIVILGDFNDTPDSPPYLAVRGDGTTQYVDITQSMPAANRWTYEFQGKLELIDHQFASPILAPMLDAASVTIRHGADVDDASDHAPVIATYMVN
ncbi:MAG: endonuclease/exonuclease/phosphatase family protein [Polyangiaceae bacterium]|nr:endonuclease/exonuclease/phosphatase family protein [Polyangiaceae bacterium]